MLRTTDSASMLKRTAELVPEVVAVKTELSAKKPVDCMFLAIVDIVDLSTHLIVAGERERSLASAAGFDHSPLSEEVEQFAGSAAKNLYKMAPGKVSRKADFIPPLTDAVEAGWSPTKVTSNRSELDLAKLAKHSQVTVEYSPQAPSGKFVRSQSGGLENIVEPTPLTEEAVAGDKRKLPF